MSDHVAQDQNPKFVRVNSMFNVFEVALFFFIGQIKFINSYKY